jgi:hypothetical protein
MGMLGLMLDGDLCRPEALFLHLGRRQSHARQVQAGDAGVDLFQIDARINQGAQGHVTADAAGTIKVCDFHFTPIRCSRMYNSKPS